MTAAIDLPTIDTPQVVFEDLLHHIKQAITNHPRSQQTRIGPSGIGVECRRALAHALAGDEPPDRETPWKPTVGTAVHAWVEQAITASNAMLTPTQPRFLLEHRVTVGDINGTVITGSCDLFDVATGIVNDWKCVGPTRLNTYKRKGPGEQYRVQAHLYGRGWQRAGHTVRHVMITFLPRDGELRDAFQWSEPYDETVAVQALARATGIAQLIDSIGVDATVGLYPPCDNQWCDWCGTKQPFTRNGGTFFNPSYTPPTPQHATTLSN